jgi:hypothetical protein
MPVDLGHRGPEPLPQLRLHRVQELSLALQVVGVVEMEPHLDDAEIRGHALRIGAGVARDEGTQGGDGRMGIATCEALPC